MSPLCYSSLIIQINSATYHLRTTMLITVPLLIYAACPLGRTYSSTSASHTQFKAAFNWRLASALHLVLAWDCIVVPHYLLLGYWLELLLIQFISRLQLEYRRFLPEYRAGYPVQYSYIVAYVNQSSINIFWFR